MSHFLRFSDVLKTKKRNAKVLILGSYDAREMLKRLKAFLRARGFDKTRLVEDWIDEKEIHPDSFDEHFRKKSFYYIDNWAEILIFVFLKGVNNLSVGREWAHMIESVKEKCRCSVILRHKGLNLGSLVRGDIGAERVREEPFEDENELYELAFSSCFNVLYTLESSKQTKA